MNGATDLLNLSVFNGYSPVLPASIPILVASNGATLVDNVPDSGWTIAGPSNFNYTIQKPGDPNGVAGEIVLYLTAGNPSVKWTAGASSSTWDTAAANWSPATNNGVYQNGYNVTFDDTNTSGFSAISVTSSGVMPNSVTVNNALVNYSFSGGSIGATLGLTKKGIGSLTLNNVNTYGTVTISGGTVTVGNTGSLAASSVNVAAASYLNVNSSGTLGSGTVLADNGTVTFNNASQTLATLSGPGLVTLNGTTLNPGALTLTGTINGTGGLIYNTGGGTIQANSTATLLYSGATTINGPGTFQASADANFGNTTASVGGINLNNAALEITSGFSTNRVLTLGSSASTVVVDANQILTLNSSMLATGAGALTQNGGGTLQIGSTAMLPAGVNVTATGGGVLDLGGNTHAPGVVTIGGGGSTIQNGTLNATGYVFNGNGIVSANLQGNVPLTVNSGGNAILVGNNTISGTSTVNSGGVLRLSNNQSIGTSVVALAGGTMSVNTVNGAPGQGLTGQFYNGSPTVNNANPNLNDLLTFNNQVGLLTPQATYVTSGTSGSQTNLDFSNNNYGNNPAFAALGFSGTLNYEARLSGAINLTSPGIYTFGTTSDDGSMLWVDGNMIVNNNAYQGATTKTGTINITTPGLHNITVGYYQGGGGEGLLVGYTPPSGGSVTIPNSVLAPTASNSTYTNPVKMSASSTLDIQGTQLADMGPLTISAAGQTLNVTGDGVLNQYIGALRFPSVTLAGGAGSYGFNVGSGELVVSSLSDGATAATITKSGPGYLTLTGNNAFSGGTNFQVTGGTLAVVGQNLNGGPLGTPP